MTEQTKQTKIHILDTLTANQIAAGEVVERPASVVKELLENAIDAGATKIEVRIYDTNCEKIQVSDNGSGMSPADMRLAVQRHATSKIRTAADLEHLSTLGFRGEALPSIASVSQLTIASKTADAEHAYLMQVINGKASVPEVSAAKNGTTVLVDRLFFNAPARRKFLKSPRTEMGAISDIVSQLAVSHPEIAFTLRHGNHRTIVTAGNGDLAQAVLAAYGNDMAQNLLHVTGDLLSGLVSLPSYSRSQRNYHFFINGRSVRSRELSLAVEDGYDTLLPAQRYPAVFLFLTLPLDSVDVNVHPNKLEVKLRDPKTVKEAIAEAIRFALYKSERLVPRLGQIPEPEVLQRDRIDAEPPLSPVTPAIAPPPIISFNRVGERQTLSPTALYKALYQGALPMKPRSASTQMSMLQDTAPDDPPQSIVFPPQKLRYSSLHIIGQYKGTYILAAGEAGLYIIDQHAAAERVIYERIAAQTEDTADSAMLAVPLRIQLSQSEHILLTDHILELRDFGFILEYFGDTTYIIRGVPAWYDDDQAERLLLAVLDSIRAEGKSSMRKLRREELFLAACKQAIKANRYLTAQDISGLFAQLDACESSSTCPHGRPIAVLLTEKELRKRFLRSGI